MSFKFQHRKLQKRHIDLKEINDRKLEPYKIFLNKFAYHNHDYHKLNLFEIVEIKFNKRNEVIVRSQKGKYYLINKISIFS